MPSLSTALPVEKRATPLNLATSLMRSLDYGADGRLRNAYLQSVSVYRCVWIRAHAVAQGRLLWYQRRPAGDVELPETHPIVKLFSAPSGTYIPGQPYWGTAQLLSTRSGTAGFHASIYSSSLSELTALVFRRRFAGSQLG